MFKMSKKNPDALGPYSSHHGQIKQRLPLTGFNSNCELARVLKEIHGPLNLYKIGA
jgi:hypothetical protein